MCNHWRRSAAIQMFHWTPVRTYLYVFFWPETTKDLEGPCGVERLGAELSTLGSEVWCVKRSSNAPT
jgi:hypothetical protein